MSADTRDWHLTINFAWRPLRTPQTINCPRCHGRGEVGGGFKDMDGPRECPECFGSRIKTLPMDPPMEAVPSYPAGLEEHMRQAYRSFFSPTSAAGANATRSDPMLDGAEATRPGKQAPSTPVAAKQGQQ